MYNGWCGEGTEVEDNGRKCITNVKWKVPTCFYADDTVDFAETGMS